MSRTSPLGTLSCGLVAGVTATAAMTGYQLLVARLGDEKHPAKPTSWKEAPAPAQVGKQILTGVFQRKVELDQSDRLTTVMHWAYGTSWGAAYGLLRGSFAIPTLAGGAAFGTGVWAMSYAQLVPMGIYEAPWKYPPKSLGLDLSYHLVYDVAAAFASRQSQPIGPRVED